VSILGTRVIRTEDPRFLTTGGIFTDDMRLPGACHVHFVRSPVAHARIRSVDVSAALQAPGVVAAFTAADLAVATTDRMFRRVAAQGGAITTASPPEALHDLRKRCKELRYVLEFFAPLHDPVTYRKVVGDLKQLQDCLGAFQDSQVQREEIRALADAMLAERAAPAATLLAMGEIAANLALSQAEARADFAQRFTRFAGPAGQQRFRALLDRPRLTSAPGGAGQ